MLATITNTNVDTVVNAMKLFKELGMVEILDDKTIYMNEVSKMLGAETYWAQKKREERQKNKLPQQEAPKIGHCPTNVQAESNVSNQEIEKEIDIEIEKERELETGHPAPAAYGRYHNVILSDTELDGLKTELPGKWEYYIDRLSCHIASSGRKYKSHAATIFKWAQEDAAKKAPKKGIPDYTCKEGESL